MPRGERQEVQVLTATIAPGQSTVFHTHRFPVTAYMLEGAFTLEMEGRDTVTVRAGQSLIEPPGVRTIATLPCPAVQSAASRGPAAAPVSNPGSRTTATSGDARPSARSAIWS